MRWLRRKVDERDLDREIRADLDLEAAEQQERGLSPEEARYAARRTFGNPALVKEEVRESGDGHQLTDQFKTLVTPRGYFGNTGVLRWRPCLRSLSGSARMLPCLL
jgi:hypothetical protein